MNRRIVLILLALAATIAAAHAQKMTETYHQDSLLIDVETQEVVVQASPCLRRGDRNIYFPTAQQKQLSTNALGLLEKMQLNGLQVNSLFNTVEVSGGGTPVFCINGRPVELKDILALKPDEVARVEHNDNPGARFKDAAVVINYKLKQSMQGGGFMADLMEAVNTVYGVNRVSGKYNHKASEWSVNYDMQHAAFKEFYNENREEYLFDDNRHVLQQEEGIPGRLRYNHHWLTLNYNYLKADNRMLNVALRGKYLNTPKSELDSRLYNPELSTSPLELLNHSRDHSATTALDLYYQHNLPRRQTLILDFTGSYTDTDSRLDYLISQDNASSPLSRLSNNVDGKKYALIAVSPLREVRLPHRHVEHRPEADLRLRQQPLLRHREHGEPPAQLRTLPLHRMEPQDGKMEPVRRYGRQLPPGKPRRAVLPSPAAAPHPPCRIHPLGPLHHPISGQRGEHRPHPGRAELRGAATGLLPAAPRQCPAHPFHRIPQPADPRLPPHRLEHRPQPQLPLPQQPHHGADPAGAEPLCTRDGQPGQLAEMERRIRIPLPADARTDFAACRPRHGLL